MAVRDMLWGVGWMILFDRGCVVPVFTEVMKSRLVIKQDNQYSWKRMCFCDSNYVYTNCIFCEEYLDSLQGENFCV